MSDKIAKLDAIANAMMDSRPDLAPMSLDEWLLEHSSKLSIRERKACVAILELYPEYGG
ncbi:hypothetical protein FHV99_004625 [Ochrobactrum sp. P20RRXII]|nr:hypothetical protein [Ochrobactrum sp. P20RRXII]NIH77373.1 hypothetical protein [Ochrobactrum sp. P20RRXII]